MALLGVLNYWIVIALMMIGLYVIIAANNFIKKIIGLNIFQSAVFILYISIGKVSGATAPILIDEPTAYSNPLPHVLILTAIVVGVATTAVGLAICVRLRSAFGTVDDHEVQQIENQD